MCVCIGCKITPQKGLLMLKAVSNLWFIFFAEGYKMQCTAFNPATPWILNSFEKTAALLWSQHIVAYHLEIATYFLYTKVNGIQPELAYLWLLSFANLESRSESVGRSETVIDVSVLHYREWMCSGGIWKRKLHMNYYYCYIIWVRLQGFVCSGLGRRVKSLEQCYVRAH